MEGVIGDILKAVLSTAGLVAALGWGCAVWLAYRNVIDRRAQDDRDDKRVEWEREQKKLDDELFERRTTAMEANATASGRAATALEQVQQNMVLVLTAVSSRGRG